MNAADAAWLLKLALGRPPRHDDRERLRTIAASAAAVEVSEDSPDWWEITQLQRMKFGTEEEYLEHCIKWEADPAYRESNPYIA